MRRLACIILGLLLLSGCTVNKAPQQKQYTATFLNLFDTVTTVVGKAESQEAFEEKIQPLYNELEYYHKLFDIYEEYEGINNLKTVNDKAAVSPVKVDTVILELLQDCKDYYLSTDGTFNFAMGSVLKLWHDARQDGINDPENAYLPDSDKLKEAALHIDPKNVILDTENSTVFFADPHLRLDVGGIAKGWAVQRAGQNASKDLLLSVGGNVYATGPKNEKGNPWAVGIKNPNDDSKYLHTLNITKGSVVTSGSYHRAYAVDGKLYHHIIDPDTLYPSEKWVSVTIVTEDSGLSDVLSTSLFLLDREDGQVLLDRFGAKAMWVDAKGNKYYSSGFQELIKN